MYAIHKIHMSLQCCISIYFLQLGCQINTKQMWCSVLRERALQQIFSRNWWKQAAKSKVKELRISISILFINTWLYWSFSMRPKKNCYIGVTRPTLNLGPTLHLFFLNFGDKNKTNTGRPSLNKANKKVVSKNMTMQDHIEIIDIFFVPLKQLIKNVGKHLRMPFNSLITVLMANVYCVICI